MYLRDRGRGGTGERESVRVCVCVCARACVTGGRLGRRGEDEEEERAFKCVAGEKVGVR